MTIERCAFAALAVVLAGCGQHAPPPADAGAAHHDPHLTRALANAQLLANVQRLQQLLDQAQMASHQLDAFRDLQIVGMDSGEVPSFELTAPNGAQYSSQSLVGQQPFVTVFFATWCDYCQVELKAMQAALAKTGPMRIIPVSVDGPETWSKVPSYLASFGIHDSAVRASDYPRFSASYDPFDTVPLLVIVGRHGGLVDCLVGYDPAHAERLVASLQLARDVNADTRLQITATF